MSIYPDKKNGKLTGRFRVEVMVNYVPYRRRVDTIGEARALEAEWLGLKAQGLAPVVEPSTRKGGRPSTTQSAALASCLQMPVGTPQGLVEAFKALQASYEPEPSWLFSKARLAADGKLWTKPRANSTNMANLRIIQEAMGDVELNEVDDTWVLDLKENLQDTRTAKDGETPIANATVNRFLASLSKFLKYAIAKKWRTVRDLPKLEYGKEGEGRIRVFTEEEEVQLYANLAERSAKACFTAIRTGMRRGELLSIEAHQLSADRVTLWGTGTKSGKSRTIRIRQDTYEALKWLVVEGNMPTVQMLRKDWEVARKAMDMADDPEFVFHATRHTFATRAVEAGVPIRTLQEILGHANIKMTERYAKVTAKAHENALDMMFGVQDLEALAA